LRFEIPAKQETFWGMNMSGNYFNAKVLFPCFIILLFASKVSAQPVLFKEPLSPRIANYDIDVRLDAEDRMIYASELLTWHNKTKDTITELQFHLYPNAFRNTESTFLKDKSRKDLKELIKGDGWGFIEVTGITLASGEDLTADMEYIQPDDDNEYDKTVLRLPLPRAIQPGDSIKVNIDFTTKLPEPPFARSGCKKEFFFVSQWFPKVGVYEDGKWNCHQYHPTTEFFADFGVYNVRMTVPGENIVGATGLEFKRINNGDGTATHFYHAEDVHDFAWTTSPNFVEFKGTTQDVDIRVLMQKGHKRQGERHLEAAKLGVEYFQNWFGDYPYPNLTVVDPRHGAHGAGGMEYPTLITAGTFTGMPKTVRAPEMVIIHEFGHNFWYHMVASNEFEHAWLDEGVNTYSEIQIMKDIWGKASAADLAGIKADDMQMRRFSYIAAPDSDPIERNAWEYYSRGSYSAMAYSKPALMLVTLENYLGRETMHKVMRAYFERWKFKHPKTKDFVDVANEFAGENLDWYFNQALYSNAVLDYSLDYVSSEKIEKGQGYDYTLSVSDDASTKALEPDTETMYLSKVQVRRLGGFKFPVEIEVIFENGEKIHETWDGRDYWKKYQYIKPSKLVSATLDPEFKVPLDINWYNNSRTVKEQKKAEKGANVYLDMMKFLIKQHEFDKGNINKKGG